MSFFLSRLIIFFFLTWSFDLFANLQVLPTRILLTDKNPAGSISLRNTSNKTVKYSMKPIFYRMMPDGSLKETRTPTLEENPAFEFIRYSPQMVTLPPFGVASNQSTEQIVRIMAMRENSAHLKDGDYRMHLIFQEVEEVEKQKEEENQGSLLKMQLKAKMAVAVPIVYRHGTTSVQVSLSNPKIIQNNQGKPTIQVVIKQNGNQFAHGEMKAVLISNKKPIQIGYIKGLSLYTRERLFHFVLDLPQNITLEKARVRLEFSEIEEEGGRLLASTDLNL